MMPHGPRLSIKPGNGRDHYAADDSGIPAPVRVPWVNARDVVMFIIALATSASVAFGSWYAVKYRTEQNAADIAAIRSRVERVEANEGDLRTDLRVLVNEVKNLSTQFEKTDQRLERIELRQTGVPVPVPAK